MSKRLIASVLSEFLVCVLVNIADTLAQSAGGLRGRIRIQDGQTAVGAKGRVLMTDRL